MAIASVNAASSTSTNWLKEAQQSIADSESPGGMLGALQDARSGSASIKTFLAKSQNQAYALAQITASAQTSSNQLLVQMSQTAAKKRQDELAALAAKLNPVQTNFTPSQGLDAFIYFEDGSSLDPTHTLMNFAIGKKPN